MGSSAAKSLSAKAKRWGELDGCSNSVPSSSLVCVPSSFWMWSLAQSLWPLSLSPPFSWGRKKGRMVMAKWRKREQPPLSLHCSFSTMGRTSRAMLHGSPHGPPAWAAHPVTWSAPPRHSKDLGNAAAFPGSSADTTPLTAHIWGFRHLQNLHWLG